MPTINSKAISRLAVIQALYQILLEGNIVNLNKKEINIEYLITSLKNYYKKDILGDDVGIKSKETLKVKINNKFLEELLRFSVENMDNIIKKIEPNLSKEWIFERMHPTLQAVLITGFCEILYFPEVPSKVIISEYTDIAADIIEKKEVGFVNSILENASSILRKEG